MREEQENRIEIIVARLDERVKSIQEREEEQKEVNKDIINKYPLF